MDKREQDDTVGTDAGKALRKYLKVPETMPDEKVQQKLSQVVGQMEKEATAKKADYPSQYQDVSLAIQCCPTASMYAEQRKRLRELQTKVRALETLKLCPNLCIQFQDLTWNDYYKGGNNKYPDVVGMQAKVGKNALLEKMMLFDLLQNERHQCCKFDPTAVPELPEVHLDCPALIIPSGGRDGEWLGTALKNPDKFWWVRCMDFSQVIFVVSNEEIANYKEFVRKGLTVVGYDGFGIGCGRAVGANIAKKLGRVCIMTDDRTKGLSCYGADMNTKEQLHGMMDPDHYLYWEDKPFIMGVPPKGELNILTIINPSSPEPEQPVFTPYFIASKEDKGLYQYCRVLQLRTGNKLLGEIPTTEMPLLQVHFDADNPTCVNTARKYEGKKGQALSCVTSCQLYHSTGRDKPLDWKHLSGPGLFKNQWDAIKMQDSAMFLLLKEIVDEIMKYPEAKDVPKEVWEQFDKYMAPWFS